MSKKANEAALCRTFAAGARAAGWKVYPEANNWDMILVWAGEPRHFNSTDSGPRPPGISHHFGPDCHVQPGDQVGVQAKMRASVDVLAQAIPKHCAEIKVSPDYRLIIVPTASSEFRHVCEFMGIGVAEEAQSFAINLHQRWKTPQREWLPPIEADFEAGHSSPKKLSKWRVGALRLLNRMRVRGYATIDEFRELDVNPKKWVDARWIRGRYITGTRCYVYSLHPLVEAWRLPDFGYEAERDAIALQDGLTCPPPTPPSQSPTC